MTGKEILQEEFERAGIRGYKAEGVDAFLAKIAAYVDKQEEEKNDLIYKVKILAEKVEEYKMDEENIREALLGAQKLGTSILNEAKAKSEGMLQEARSTYEATIVQAKSKAESLTKETIQKANMDLNELRRESERERILLEKMKKEISSFRASIYKQYKSHLDMLASLPVPSTEVKPATVDATPEAPKTISVNTENTKPPFEPATPRVQFFDQDAEPVVKLENDQSVEDKLKPDNGLFFTKAQTVASDIVSSSKELEKEEAGQTKEFANGPPSGENPHNPQQGSNANPHFNPNDNKTVDEKEKAKEKSALPSLSNSQEFKVNAGTQSNGQRPNYMEKFGELKFGGFAQSDK